ncbi:MAG TPA: hypothetical protein VHK69_03155 [Chitinophagaceae bacterium]|jgi:hypothetical protein|nr:hypothetical protein [Chitinophagaceae bacterium]
MYNILVDVHSIGRWVVLLLLLIALFKSMSAGNRAYDNGDRKVGLFLTIAADLMLLIGLYLWAAGDWGLKRIQELGMGGVMENDSIRFYAIEHMVGMLIAIALLHIGKAQGKKSVPDRVKHRRSAIFYALGLLVMLATIPWPFREVGAGRGWF